MKPKQTGGRGGAMRWGRGKTPGGGEASAGGWRQPGGGGRGSMAVGEAAMLVRGGGGPTWRGGGGAPALRVGRGRLFQGGVSCGAGWQLTRKGGTSQMNERVVSGLGTRGNTAVEGVEVAVNGGWRQQAFGGGALVWCEDAGGGGWQQLVQGAPAVCGGVGPACRAGGVVASCGWGKRAAQPLAATQSTTQMLACLQNTGEEEASVFVGWIGWFQAEGYGAAS